MAKRKSIYDWAEIQKAYDAGLSYTDLKTTFGVHGSSLQLARDRGDFKPRTKNERRLGKTPEENLAVLYEWSILQTDYDSGCSMAGLREKHGASMATLNRARKQGLLKTRTLSEAMQQKLERGWKPTPMSEEARVRMSERQTLNYKGGFCKWYWVGDQHVQGTWERDAGLKLTELGIEWRKCSGKKDMIEYFLDEATHRYLPDFYLPAHDVYLEIKGFWWRNDRAKMDAVLSQSSKHIVILEKDAYYDLIQEGTLPLLQSIT